MRSLILLFTIILSTNCFATHIISGNIKYEYLRKTENGNSQYLIQVDLVRDCINGQVVFDESIELGIYSNTPNSPLYQKVSFGLTYKHEMPQVYNCLKSEIRKVFEDKACFENGVYQTIISLPPSTTGYTLLFSRCCRNELENIALLGSFPNQGFEVRTTIESTTNLNSSSLMDVTPKIVAINDTARFPFELIDVQGDSLSIELTSAIKGASPANPKPNPQPNLSDATPIVYESGYSGQFPMGSTNGAFINLNNEEFTLMATSPGMYLLAFKIREYRKDVIISEYIKEIIVQAFDMPDNPFEFDNLPRNFTLTYEPQQSALLNWTNCLGDVTGYEVYRSENIGTFQLLSTVESTFYTDKSISSRTNYSYYVKGLPKSGQQSGNSDTLSLYAYGLSIDESETAQFKWFPNPVSHYLSVINNKPMTSITIITLHGKEVLQTALNSTKEAKISVEGLQKGLYVLKVETSQGTSSHKILVE